MEEASSSSSRTANVGSSSERIDERPEVTTARAAFLTRPVQENAFNFLFASHASNLSENERVQLQNDEQGKKTVIISDLLGLESVSGNSWQDLLPQIKGQGNAIFAQVEEKMTANALEAWQAFHPGEAIPNPLPFRHELEMCKTQVRNSLVQLTNMPSDASNQAISGPANQIIDALTTICHTLIPRSPDQPAAANPGPDVTENPATDKGVSFGNIHNQQGDTIHNHYYGTPPGNDNTSGRPSGTVVSEKVTTTEHTSSTILPPGEHHKGVPTAARAAMADMGTQTDSPENVAQEPTRKGAQPPKSIGDDVLDAEMEQPIANDEQFIDSLTLTHTPLKEIKQAKKEVNKDVNVGVAQFYVRAIAHNIAAVKMQVVASVPHSANQPLFTGNLKRSPQPRQEVDYQAGKNSFADLKGVRNLINAWENVAIEESNVPVHPNGLNPESDAGYESTAGSYLSTMYDSETATLNSIDSNGDDVPRNVSRRMSESSAAESGYDSEGDHNSLASTNELDHAPQVQVDETNHPGNKVDSNIVNNVEKGSMVREKMALFNKGNEVKSESIRQNFRWGVEENNRVYTTEAKPMTMPTPDMFKK
ncbi:hypothetical protein [Sodalis glossinidius]|uniref:hypothetical protein n=1 Tax=Sodalis glossinidius TaxID=63612 RepID=UPI0005A436B8|nr:hypothetical protein [Sodalis glossinidius]